MLENFTGDTNLKNSEQQFQCSTGKNVIGRSVLSQIKEHIHKHFPGGFAPRPPQGVLDLEVSTEPDALFHKPHVLHISESEVHGNSLTIPLPSGAC